MIIVCSKDLTDCINGIAFRITKVVPDEIGFDLAYIGGAYGVP